MSKNLENGEELERIVKEKKTIVLSFWAEWAEPSVKLNELFDQLAQFNSKLVFLKVEAEKVSEIAEHFQVSSVPTFVFLKGGKVIHKIEGAFGSQLTEQVAKLSSSVSTTAETKKEVPKKNMNERLEKLINLGTVTLFMKGSPSAPQCGFSRKIVDLLNEQGIKFESFNIFEDEEVRNALKEYSNWPTYPQLYIAGKLVGGLDIVKELAEEGELKGMVPTTTPPFASSSVTASAPTAKPEVAPEDLKEKIELLLNSSKVMLFMKGTPETPQCGFSRKIVDLLNGEGVKFNTFNILADEEIRTGLKEYSNWPTYPQLYVNAKLVGGLDIVKELVEEGEFASLLA